jgi:hypothetical protein
VSTSQQSKLDTPAVIGAVGVVDRVVEPGDLDAAVREGLSSLGRKRPEFKGR